LSIDRRRFIALGGISLLASACGDAQLRKARGFVKIAERGNEKLERLLMHRGSRNIAPEDAKAAGDAFPRYFISKTMPQWDEAARGAWRLEVSGAVRQPLSLTLDDLARLPRVRQRVNHYCVEGWTAVAVWTGVRVSELARLAGLKPDAGYVDFQSFDSDYHESWDMESAMHPQSLIAYGMDDAFLGAAHGAPARLHSPVKLGYKSVKYLTKIVFMPERNGGYWSDQGYEWYAGV
jgi:DMSO/TMAO reductase YedYZ molybdopterin-dependent catalytic subunit